MDAVILAGGKGSRLEGVMPAYWKPLMPINGVPLIRRIWEQCHVQEAVENVFVVVAPDNAKQVAEVLHGRRSCTYIIVQPEALGPGHALGLALELSRADTALIVMGDNLLEDDDVEKVAELGVENEFVIGTAEVAGHEATRFTRIYADGLIEEGPNLRPGIQGPTTVWCGPLVVPVAGMLEALYKGGDDPGERKIGTHLRYIHKEPMLVPCAAIDIGTPETIMEVSQ